MYQTTCYVMRINKLSLFLKTSCHRPGYFMEMNGMKAPPTMPWRRPATDTGAVGRWKHREGSGQWCLQQNERADKKKGWSRPRHRRVNSMVGEGKRGTYQWWLSDLWPGIPTRIKDRRVQEGLEGGVLGKTVNAALRPLSSRHWEQTGKVQEIAVQTNLEPNRRWTDGQNRSCFRW